MCVNSNNNKRQNVRLSSLIPIKVIFEDGRPSLEGLVDNIGFGGAKLRLPASVQVGEVVQLALKHHQIMMLVAAKCIWVKQDISIGYEYCAGFSFEEPAADIYIKLREILMQLADNDRMEI
jgi:hypothetical protein